MPLSANSHNAYSLRLLSVLTTVCQVFVMLFLLFSFALRAAELPSAVADIIKQSPLTGEQVSLWVAPVDGGKALVDYHSETPRTPASVIKVVTTGVGLLLLGADYRWKTDFYIDGDLQNGVLGGNLIIKGHGDPYWVQEDMADAVSALKINGLSEIKGDIILDGSDFMPSQESPEQFDGHGIEPYNAIPHALNINFRTIQLIFKVENGQIRIHTDPTLHYTRIENKMGLNQAKKCRGKGFSPNIKVDYMRDLVMVSGSMSRHCKAIRLNKVLTDAGDLYFGHFRKAWQAQGGSLTGVWYYGDVPDKAKLFYTALSRLPLSAQIAAMNKRSNNVMTRQLFLSLGAKATQPPASLAKSRAVVMNQLQRLGLDTQHLFIDNGSGLSRQSRISAKQLGDFLIAMQVDADLGAVFEQSLAVTGVDGTLRHRLKNTPLAGNAKGKTGTIKRVKSLAGYMHSQRGVKYVYVVLLEGTNASAGRPLMDNLLQWLYKQ